MLNILNRILGGNKSEKDVKKIEPHVGKINHFFNEYQSLANDALRSKTTEFKQRIQDHLQEIDKEIQAKKDEADASSFIQGYLIFFISIPLHYPEQKAFWLAYHARCRSSFFQCI